MWEELVHDMNKQKSYTKVWKAENGQAVSMEEQPQVHYYKLDMVKNRAEAELLLKEMETDNGTINAVVYGDSHPYYVKDWTIYEQSPLDFYDYEYTKKEVIIKITSEGDKTRDTTIEMEGWMNPSKEFWVLIKRYDSETEREEERVEEEGEEESEEEPEEGEEEGEEEF